MSEYEPRMMKFKLTYPNILTIGATLALAAGAVVFAAAYPSRGETLSDLGWALLTLLALAACVVLMARFGLIAWLTLILLGYIVGLVSALQLLTVPNVVGGYRVAVLTVVTFAGHGLVIGMFGEFIIRMHKLTHGVLDRIIGDGIRPANDRKSDEEVRPSENRE